MPRELVKTAFALFSPTGDVLTYHDKKFVLRCYRSHWIAHCLGSYEPVTRVVMESLFHPGMVFVDGGANVGLYSVLASKVVGSQGMIHAFEPHPVVHSMLISNLSVNGCDNVKPWKAALGSATGTASLYHSAEPGSHSLFESNSGERYSVKVLPLDEAVGNDRVDLVKLDLEGCEPLALQGMHSILARRSKPILMMEFCSSWLKRASVSPSDILELLESRGYELKAIDDNHRRGPFDLDAREKRAIEQDDFDYNLLCIPER
ncbi:MAG: FkbM family methyltransferase [Acidobacteriota bacterium]